MKILAWNMRGLNSLVKQHMLKYTLLDQKANILLLQKLKMRSKNFQKTMKVVWPSVEFFVNDVEGESKGIATQWNPTSFTSRLIHSDKNCLIVKLKCLQTRFEWIFINI